MTRKRALLLIFIISMFGFWLRMVGNTIVPPDLSNDEISIAYDAYSISKTGKDEHNHPWPVAFESLGTYKAPLYAYLLAPLMLISRNTDFVAKIPSLVAGTLTIGVIGLIALELFKDYWIGPLASLVLAVTPWHIHASRLVLESNVALFFMATGWLLFLVAWRKQKKLRLVMLSATFLALSMYAYHTEWILVPLMMLFVAWFYLKKENWKLALIFMECVVLLCLPLAAGYIDNLGTGARANSQVIWKEGRVEDILKQYPFIGTKAAIVGKIFISNYLAYSNPGYLFFNGLALFPNYHPYQLGLFLSPFIIFAVLGLLTFKKYLNKKYVIFIIFWILVALIVPAMTQGGTNNVRDLPAVLPYTLLIAVGIFQMGKYFKKILFVTGGLSVGMFLVWALVYYYHFPLETAEGYQGYRSVATYLTSVTQPTSVIRFDDRFGIKNQLVGAPYLYFAYYQQWNPRVLQTRTKTAMVSEHGTYEGGGIDWNRESIIKDTFYVVGTGNQPPASIKNKLELMSTFTDVSGREAFEVWKGQ